jgi:hypothetical protein
MISSRLPLRLHAFAGDSLPILLTTLRGFVSYALHALKKFHRQSGSCGLKAALTASNERITANE